MIFSAGLARAQTPARPSFAESLADAEPAGELSSLVGPLFDECRSTDEVEARQCRVIRDLAIEAMKDRIFSALGDDAALQWEPFDPVEKKLTLDVEGCLACVRPLETNDAKVFVTSRVPKAIRAGRAIGLDVGFHDVAQPDRAQAAKWRRTMEGRLRVQFLFRVGPVWKSGAFEGVTFVPVAHRLFDRCTGEVIAVDPPLAAAESEKSAARAEPLRDARCPETDAERQVREEAALPEQLTPRQINRALEAARARVRDCAGEFQASGTATVRLAIGGDGKLASARVLPPYEKTPAGYCIHSAVAGTTFPRFRGEPMVLEVPLPLP